MHRLCTVLLICCTMSLLCLNSQLAHAQDEKQVREKKRVGRKAAAAQESGGDFYRVIVENNLFRPLGWQKPNRDPEYALIATWIGTRGTVAKALVTERKSNQLYYVARGEKVGNAIIEKIEPNQVSLKVSNDIVTLKTEGMQFLSDSSRSGDKSGEGGKSEAAEARERNERRDERAERRGANRERDALREWLRTASPEERREKLEAIRRERGGGGRRGGAGRRGGGDDVKKDEENWDEIKGK